jgi:TonB family protein
MSARHRGRRWLLLCLLAALGGWRTPVGRAETAPPGEPEVLPVLLEAAPAVYPAAELRAGREGDVLLELLVSETGAVDSVRVLASLTPACDSAAASAAAGWRFDPARVGGEAVAVRLVYRYHFSVWEEALRLPEQVNLTGRVRAAGSGMPVPGARILASFPSAATDSLLPLPWPLYWERLGACAGQWRAGEMLVTAADSSGAFAFRLLPPGDVSLVIAASGFDTLRARARIEADVRSVGEAWLQPSLQADYELVVYGEAVPREVTRQRLSAVEVERLPGFGGDAVRSVQALPGIARPMLTDPGAIVVRGAGGGDSRFVLDGVDIPLLFHYGGVKSTYNSLALGSVDLYPGGYGPRFGGCIGGVVELRGRPARTEGWRRIVDASALDASIHVEGPLGKRGGLLLTARRSFAGELLRAVFAGRDDLELTLAPYYWDGVARLDWRPRAADRLFLTAFAAKDRMELMFPEEERGSPEVNQATNAVDVDLQFSRFILGYDARLGERASNELRAAWGQSAETGHVFGYYDFDLRGPYTKLRDELSVRLAPTLDLRSGVDFTDVPVTYRVRALGWPASAQDKGSSALAFFGALEWRPTTWLQLAPGLRHDEYRHLDAGETGLRLSARCRLGTAHTLTAAAGSYSQAPQPLDQSTDPVYGNPQLPPTLATHFTLGDEWRLSDALSVKAEAYFNTQRQIPVLTDSLGLNYLAEGEGRMAGLELMLRREVGERFFGWLAYSLSRSERRYPRRPSEVAQDPGFDNQPGASGAWDPERWVPFALDQTHHLEAVGSWRLGGRWSAGLRLQFVSGNPVTPLRSLDAGEFEFDADSGDYQQVRGDYLSGRMWPYFRCDLRVDRQFISRWAEWTVYLDVQNLNYFIYNSPEGFYYNYDFSEQREYGWIILPALGCRVEF